VLMISLNLAYLGYFKYFNFFVENISVTTGISMRFAKIALPLGISFYTFQQIPYLVGAYNRELHNIGLLKYCVVNSFFPHVIAGPIIWHREIGPQLERGRDEPVDTVMLTLGLLFFIIGLFKKIMFADNLAYVADSVFNAAQANALLTPTDAWIGALAYGLQSYFDFSGYSEMAIGIALMFGIRFPINFFSPYKATSIIEFWRRWHMTMTRFFQEFVYVPLQFAVARRYASSLSNYGAILLMMFLVGLWHGAGWTWIIWGLVHGLLLCVNHAWRHLRKVAGWPYEARQSMSLIGRMIGWTLTFAAVTAAWVLFRAPDFATATTMYKSMFLLNGIVLPEIWQIYLGDDLRAALAATGASFSGPLLSAGIAAKVSPEQVASLVFLTAFVALMPNTLQVLRFYTDGRTPRAFSAPADRIADFDWSSVQSHWRPTWGWAALAGVLFVASLTTIADDTSKTVFIYFNF
jgi:alginate O-acetyltransferase complex protein AlgI